MSWGTLNIAGVNYSLTHLDSRIIDVTPKAPRSPTYRVLVSYGCHCFARDLKPGDPVSHHVADDGGRTRCFCVDRAAYSAHLPRIIRAAQQGQAYFSQDHNMVLVERLPGVVAPYAIFFNVRRSRQKGVDVNLFVASAYDKPNLPTHLFPIPFTALIATIAKGWVPVRPAKKIKWGQKKRSPRVWRGLRENPFCIRKKRSSFEQGAVFRSLSATLIQLAPGQ
jgi:hypothetical protein